MKLIHQRIKITKIAIFIISKNKFRLPKTHNTIFFNGFHPKIIITCILGEDSDL